MTKPTNILVLFERNGGTIRPASNYTDEERKIAEEEGRLEKTMGGFEFIYTPREMLPCPFCDSDVVMHPNSLAVFGCELGIPGLDPFFAHCDGCGAEGPPGDSCKEAILKWNKRIIK